MSNRTCSIEGCDRTRGESRGLCPMHYNRLRRNGSTGAPGARTASPTATLAERLERVGWDCVVRREDLGECWEWRGSRLKSGYGRCCVGKQKIVVAHRVSYEAYFGLIPEGMLALHRCDNPPCMNPAHIFLGSHKANHDDMVSKARDVRGTRNVMAKLTLADVARIKTEFATGTVSMSALGRDLGVTQATIARVIAEVSYQQ